MDDVARAGAIRSAIAASVAAAGGVWGDSAGWEALRLERNVPRFGVDFDDKMYPQEAALEKAAVSFDKGCYLGQEVVCMLEMRGHVKRKLVSLIVEGQGLPERGAQVTDAGGAAIGEPHERRRLTDAQPRHRSRHAGSGAHTERGGPAWS